MKVGRRGLITKGLSRRRFLQAATGAVATCLPLKPRPHAGSGEALAATSSGPAFDCALMDLENRCALPESLAGYEAALASAGLKYVRTTAASLPRCRAMIIPGCMGIQTEAARRIRAWLEDGGSVLLEAGAGFADAADFAAHANFLQAHFDLHVEPPIHVWESAEDVSRVPYVDYTWPVRTKIRDFSYAVPLSKATDEVIGWIDGSPIAIRRKVGKGTLIFLGSPLGPALRIGDKEARGWLRESLSRE